jgi:hypothetical protein
MKTLSIQVLLALSSLLIDLIIDIVMSADRVRVPSPQHHVQVDKKIDRLHLLVLHRAT